MGKAQGHSAGNIPPPSAMPQTTTQQLYRAIAQLPEGDRPTDGAEHHRQQKAALISGWR